MIQLFTLSMASCDSWLCKTFTVLFFIGTVQLVVMTAVDIDDSHGPRVRRSYDSRRPSSKADNAGKTVSAPTDRANIFVTDNSTVIIAQIGGTATLPCVVRKFNQGVVSWIRRKDYHLLTVGLTTYTVDGRYLVEHVRHLQNWGLQIKSVQQRDAGLYECQVSTHPPISIFVELKVTEATAEIIGAPDLHIKSGSTLRLVCKLRQSTEQPLFVFWYHEERMINYDVTRGVSVLKAKSSSVLEMKDIEKSESGNYTCVPSNAKQASINVHVLNATAEENPAAMQQANTPTSSSNQFQPTDILLILFIALLCSVPSRSR